MISETMPGKAPAKIGLRRAGKHRPPLNRQPLGGRTLLTMTGTRTDRSDTPRGEPR